MCTGHESASAHSTDIRGRKRERERGRGRGRKGWSDGEEVQRWRDEHVYIVEDIYIYRERRRERKSERKKEREKERKSTFTMQRKRKN